MKVVYIGKEGSGKTHLMGRDTERCIDRNYKLHKKLLKRWEDRCKNLLKHAELIEKTGGNTSTIREELEKTYANPPEPRKIVSNIAYSKSLEEYAEKRGITIQYWRDIGELEHLTECDLFIDEVGAYFDSRTFADLPLSTRLWLAQAQKLGVDMYAGAQDWGQIDVSYRRLVNQLYELKKVLGTRRPSRTRPPGKNPWAIIFSWEVAPENSNDSSELKTLSIFPTIHWASKKSFSRFDTNARIPTGEYPPLQKVVRHWFDENGEIGYTRTTYR